ncbi:MAG: DUF3052 domain-containing protein [Terriglobales bacterium]|jgi:hypothetical protein
MAGYSGTPLPKKLGIKNDFRVVLWNVPSEVKADLKGALAGCRMVKNGPLDFVLLCVKSQAELKPEFLRFSKLLAPAGMIWVSWPKKSSGVASDLGENEVRGIGLDAGLVDVKVCAVNEVWSGLKFVIRLKDRN